MLIGILLLLISCNKNDTVSTTDLTFIGLSKSTSTYSGKQAAEYFELLCTFSKTTAGFFPPQVARAYGYVGITGYEAVFNGIPNATSLSNPLNGLGADLLPKADKTKAYNWALAYNAATAEIIRKMFLQALSKINAASLDSLVKSYSNRLSVGEDSNVILRSIQFGKDIAGAIYTYSTTDGGDLSYLDPFQLPYTKPTDSAAWVPTSAIQNVSTTQPSSPIPFSTGVNSEFYSQALLVNNQVKMNSAEQIEITKYWADDPFNTFTPTGHTFGILSQILQENRASLEKSVIGFAKLSIAENDAFICCWKGKYQYNLIRPVSYIKKYINPAFTTVIGTPPFPAYTSGHSCEMGAGSKIFISLFANENGDYTFTDYSQLKYGLSVRNYTNFNSMADECAKSRLYGGLHYPMDNDKGLQVGRAIGNNVNTIIILPSNIH